MKRQERLFNSVERPVPPPARGEAVEAAARASLRRSPCPELRHLTCEFHEGVLTLRGRVSHHCFKQLAQESVRRLEGVIEIDNRLGVFPHPGHPLPERRWWHFPPARDQWPR